MKGNVHLGRHRLNKGPKEWHKIIIKATLAGAITRYGNAHGDSHALSESWIGQLVRRRGKEVSGCSPKTDNYAIQCCASEEFDPSFITPPLKSIITSYELSSIYVASRCAAFVPRG